MQWWMTKMATSISRLSRVSNSLWMTRQVNNSFVSPPCCNSSTGAGFELVDTTGTAAFKTNALPTALNLKDFNTAFVVFGNTSSGGGANGNITSIRLVDTGGTHSRLHFCR